MTEYWVSQGNKWCDFCKIYIANNPLSIRTHELGQRHKNNVAQKLASMKKESTAKEKEQKAAAKALEQIEEKAKRSYQKDLTAFRETKVPGEEASGLKGNPIKVAGEPKDWEYDAASGYYYNLASGFYYDSNTDLYYSSTSGKWVKQEEAFPLKNNSRPSPATGNSSAPGISKNQGGSAPGVVISAPLNPMRTVKGVPSSVAPTKRKREDGKSKIISKEEEEALKVREAARKRVEDREKHLLGLYNSYR